MSSTVFDMANAVTNLVQLEKKRLAELDELTLRQGYLVDNGLAGLRILVARTEAAAKLLRDLAPHDEALAAWLAARRVRGLGLVDAPDEPLPAIASAV